MTKFRESAKHQYQISSYLSVGAAGSWKLLKTHVLILGSFKGKNSREGVKVPRDDQHIEGYFQRAKIFFNISEQE